MNFAEYAKYYNAFYGDKDYEVEANVVDRLLQKHSTNVKTIFSIGCGTGKHDYEMTRLGYVTKGIDLSKEMLDIASDSYHSRGCVFEVGDARTYRDGKKYDACISLFHVMSYQNSNEDILNSFRTAYEQTSDNGIFIFDVWYGPGVLSDRPAVRVKRVEDSDYEYIRHAIPVMHPNDNIVDVNYSIIVKDKNTSVVHEFDETHRMRYFFKPELEMLLNEAGFSMVACVDCNTGDVPSFNSWTVYIVAKKSVNE